MKREHIQAEAAEWIVTLNDPAATEADFADWQAWMNQNPAHADAFQRLQETWRRAGAVAHAPIQNADEVIAIAPPAESRATRFQHRWAVAAVALFGVIGVAVAVWQSQSQTIATVTAETRSMQLEDGSRVSLGPETRMEVQFSDNQRSLQLEGGEAYFEVAHAPERPFSVTTPAGTVTAIGTAFVVNADPDRLVVSVTEGKVRVDLPGASATSAPVMVTAGRKLAWNEGKVRTSTLAPSADAVSFQQGKLHYDGEPLSSVIADINRYSTSKLRIDDAEVREMRYTGTVFTDSLDVWLASLPGVFPVRIEERGGERILAASK
jgi:transmembrane sensor